MKLVVTDAWRPPRTLVYAAVGSGLLLGWAFPPVDAKPLIWFGLVPLLLAIAGCANWRQAAVLGFLAGAVFFFLVLHPLVSVHSWVGWIRENAVQKAMRLNRQWYFMHFLWLLFSAWCGVFWGAWAALLKRCGRGPAAWLLIAVCGWILVPEWARAGGTFGFEWGFLGNACADWTVLRQLAALGGVSLLSALVVVVNVGVAEALTGWRERARWLAPACAAVALGAAAAWGQTSLAAIDAVPAPSMDVVMLQYYQRKYQPSDYNELGLLRGYWSMLQEALAGPSPGLADSGPASGSSAASPPRAAEVRPSLIVLPESVIKGTMALDGTPSPTKPASKTYPLELWSAWMTPLLAGTRTGVILGMDIVEHGRDHNSLSAWTGTGYAGRYHKRRLVPFAEYRPGAWGGWAIRGEGQYLAAKETQLLRLNGLVVGPFICQEVLYGWVMRTAVRDGAEVLVSGANDGVFEDRVVAAVHADIAQLRAVETGRYLVRATKTGYSAIIDPAGREHGITRWKRNATVAGRIAPRTALTPFVRHGHWVSWLAAGVLALVAALATKKGPAPFSSNRGQAPFKLRWGGRTV